METAEGVAVLRRVGDRNSVIASARDANEARQMLERLNRGARVKVGDIFEWVVGALFVAAAYDQTKSLPLSFTVAGVCLFYLAQNLASTEVPRPRLPRLKRPAWVRRPHPVRFSKARLRRSKKTASDDL